MPQNLMNGHGIHSFTEFPKPLTLVNNHYSSRPGTGRLTRMEDDELLTQFLQDAEFLEDYCLCSMKGSFYTSQAFNALRGYNRQVHDRNSAIAM